MDRINNSLGFLLNVCARLIKRNMDLNLLEYDITTGQWAVLKLLSVEGTLTQAEIAQKLNSDRATCGSVIDRLAKKEFVIKRMNNLDRRAFDISLSSMGMGIVDELTKLAIESNKQALKNVSNHEAEMLNKVLNQIIVNLEDKTWDGK